ncbi:MAG: hypothetical protein AAF204_02520 [Pseudomonadota bacterium]
MTNTSCVSSGLVQFLTSPEKESTHEIVSVSSTSSTDTIILGIKRGLNSPEEFFVHLVKPSIVNESLSPSNMHNVEHFLDYMGFFNGEDVPIADEYHIGPLNADQTIELAEFAHAKHRANTADKMALLASHAFLDALKPEPEAPAIDNVFQFPSQSFD